MIDPGLRQEAERIHARVIWLVGLGGVAISALLVVIAWWFVIPSPAAGHPPAGPSPLEHRLFDRATGGSDARTVAAHRLERYEWIDRKRRVVRIPVERAIDAVVADPALIGAGLPAVVLELAR